MTGGHRMDKLGLSGYVHHSESEAAVGRRTLLAKTRKRSHTSNQKNNHTPSEHVLRHTTRAQTRASVCSELIPHHCLRR
jgi:hypothetical protein